MMNYFIFDRHYDTGHALERPPPPSKMAGGRQGLTCLQSATEFVEFGAFCAAQPSCQVAEAPYPLSA